MNQELIQLAKNFNETQKQDFNALVSLGYSPDDAVTTILGGTNTDKTFKEQAVPALQQIGQGFKDIGTLKPRNILGGTADIIRGTFGVAGAGLETLDDQVLSGETGRLLTKAVSPIAESKLVQDIMTELNAFDQRTGGVAGDITTIASVIPTGWITRGVTKGVGSAVSKLKSKPLIEYIPNTLSSTRAGEAIKGVAKNIGQRVELNVGRVRSSLREQKYLSSLPEKEARAIRAGVSVEDISTFKEILKNPAEGKVLKEMFENASKGVVDKKLTKGDIVSPNTNKSLIEEARKYKSAEEFVKAQEAPKTVTVWNKSKFSNEGAYTERPVIRKVENKTLYQGGDDSRQFWTPDKKYAEQFGNVKEKTGTFYQIDNGNRMTEVYVDASKTKSELTDIWNKANKTNADDALIQEAEKYKGVEGFADKTAKADAQRQILGREFLKPIEYLTEQKVKIGNNLGEIRRGLDATKKINTNPAYQKFYKMLTDKYGAKINKSEFVVDATGASGALEKATVDALAPQLKKLYSQTFTTQKDLDNWLRASLQEFDIVNAVDKIKAPDTATQIIRDTRAIYKELMPKAYNDALENYAKVVTPLGKINKTLKITNNIDDLSVKDLKAGEIARRLGGNASADLKEIMAGVLEVADEFGYTGKVNLSRLATIADDIDKMYDINRVSSLRGDVSAAVSGLPPTTLTGAALKVVDTLLGGNYSKEETRRLLKEWIETQ